MGKLIQFVAATEIWGKEAGRPDKMRIALTLIFAAIMSMPLLHAVQFEAGQPFPDLVLPLLEDGRPAAISDFQGHKLVLHIWASW